MKKSYPHSTKERVFQALCKGSTWFSGQEIADTLGISRAAVAKHVNSLRAEGNVIESAPKRGYRLVMRAETVSREAVLGHLSTKELGRGAWHALEHTSSTGNELVSLALHGAAQGTMVTAEAQSQGRGRQGHNWFSAPRAVQFSLLLRPASAELDLELLMQGAVVAVAQALRVLQGVDARVKTPNDVYIGTKKIAGVLIENGLRSGALEWVVVGVGCNVNTLATEFPENLREKVTSLYAECGEWTSRNLFIAQFLNFFEGWYEDIWSGADGELKKVWRELHIAEDRSSWGKNPPEAL